MDHFLFDNGRNQAVDRQLYSVDLLKDFIDFGSRVVCTASGDPHFHAG
jgi:hypothetical protein